MQNSETKTPELALDDARLAPAQPTPLSLMQKVIESGLNAESVGVMERLVALDRDMRKDAAEREFAAAFNALQKELPVIVAKTVILNRGKYEKFEDLMSAVGPLLARFGFTVAFSQDAKENRVTETCQLFHTGGASRSNSFTVRVGKGDTDTQADLKAATTAKRLALCNCLNLVIRQDLQSGEDDLASEGGFISADKVQYLREQCTELNCERAILKMAGTDKFEEIGEGSYPVLVRALEMKRKAPR